MRPADGEAGVEADADAAGRDAPEAGGRAYPASLAGARSSTR